DALVTAGDVTQQGVDYVYVIRREGAGPTPATTTTPMTMPAGRMPATNPAVPTDVLQPRSQANPMASDLKPVALLLADAPPASPPAVPPSTGGERYIQIDGKSVLVGNQGATAEGAPVTPGTAAAPAAPAAGAVPAAPGAPGTPADTTTAAPMTPMAAPATQTFEFNANNQTPNRIIRVPVMQLKNGDLRYNIVIRPQDMIIVPQPVTGEYYMEGHINRGGVYSLTARQITLKQAVAAAGGYDQLATPAKAEIIRRIGADREVYARVDLDKVGSGQQPDVYLKPNDIVRVGTNAFQPFIAAFRNAFRITYGFGFLYDRNFDTSQNNNGR